LEPKTPGETIPSRSGDPWLGRVIKDKYRLERLLGRGGFGAVYAARHLLIGTWHAIKLLHPADGAQPELVERFREEARIGTQLRHQRIVPVTDFDVEDETFFLVMDYIESNTLAQRVRQTPDEVAGHLEAWARDIAAALDYAHSRRVVHRDVKPSNILIRDQDQAAFLTDFGISRWLYSIGLTQTGSTIGTFAYMSPEQCRDEERAIDARSDIYSFAAVLFELACGRPPYGTGREALSAHQYKAIPHVRQFRPELAAAERLDVVFARGLAKSPNLRPQSAEQLVNEFADAVSGSTVTHSAQDETVLVAAGHVPPDHPISDLPTAPVMPPPAPPRPAPPSPPKSALVRRGRPPWLMPLGASVVVVVIIGSTLGVLAATGAFRPHVSPGRSGSAATHVSPSVVTTGSVSSPSPLVFSGPVFVDSPSVQLLGDRPYARGLVTIGAQQYQHGLQYQGGCAGPTQWAVSFAVPRGAHMFSTAYGSDASHPSGNFTFDVFFGDQKVLDRQVPVDSPALNFEKDVTGISTVKLSISAPIFYGCALADWGDPQFN
jgi:serine/threonine protein kinase